MTNINRNLPPVEPTPKPRPEIPAAVQFLNYSGDCRGSVGRLMGPMLGSDQLMTVVEESYDEKTDRTRIGLTYGDVTDLVIEALHG